MDTGRERCPGDAIISGFVNKRLPDDQLGPFRAHVRQCLDCRVHLAALGVTLPEQVVVRDDLDEFRTGRAFGRYTLLERLGEGTFGVVFAARDTQLERRTALKILRSARETPMQRSRFMREAKAMARLSHPNVVAVYDAGECDGHLFIAMELVEHGTLSEWMSESSRTREQIIGAFAGMAEGLMYAHGAGLVHRDLKPHNVLVDRQGRLKITDFGLVRFAEAPDVAESGLVGPTTASGCSPTETLWTKTGGLVGTPAYMSPEQRRGEVADTRSDQYSFALCLYEALFGRRPFPSPARELSPTDEETAKACAEPGRFPLSDEVRSLLVRGLANDPAARFASMEDLVLILRREGAATPVKPARRSSKSALAVGAAAMVIVAISVVSVRASRRTREIEVRPDLTAAGASLHRVESGAHRAPNDLNRAAESAEPVATRPEPRPVRGRPTPTGVPRASGTEPVSTAGPAKKSPDDDEQMLRSRR